MFNDYLRSVDKARIDVAELTWRLSSSLLNGKDLTPQEKEIFGNPVKIR